MKNKKPWWNDLLTSMWNEVCREEKNMIKSNGVARKHSMQAFKHKRKIFDKEVQRSKRKYVKEKQIEIEQLARSDQQEFWKKIGKGGIGQERQKLIPLEVILEDGSISKSPDVVMNKWKTSFSDLLNPIIHTGATEEGTLRDNSVLHLDHDMNSVITRNEVIKAVNSMKSNKASDIDNIPAEFWKNSALSDIITVLFNKCFCYGIVPDTWKLGVINPIPKS